MHSLGDHALVGVLIHSTSSWDTGEVQVHVGIHVYISPSKSLHNDNMILLTVNMRELELEALIMPSATSTMTPCS